MQSSGLEDVVAATTVLSDVDGQAGRLTIRGKSLDQLAGRLSFEAVVALLLDGFFPDLPRGGAFPAALGRARLAAFGQVAAADRRLLRLPVAEALAALLARFEDAGDAETALQLVAAPAVLTPALLRMRRGQIPVVPDPGSGHAADVLRMLTGEPPAALPAAALDSYLVTVCDHGLNASTFAARVVASTAAGLVSSVVAGLCALKGPLHGGAPGPVLDMLDAVARAGDAEAWMEAALSRGERLMGFGHRVYRVRDPRADALQRALAGLRADGRVAPERLALAEACEAAALAVLRRRKPGRPLQTNVEFYTALLLEALGFPRESFTAVFAMGRVAGWLGHVREQEAAKRLIRPQSRYVGPPPEAAA